MLSCDQKLLLFILLCVGLASADDICEKGSKLQIPLSCCLLPELYSAEVKEKCTEYSDRYAFRAMLSAKCFFACVFDENGLYKDNKIDMNATKDYLMGFFKDNVDQRDVDDSFTSCMIVLKGLTNPPGSSSPMCSTGPRILMDCFVRKMVDRCPTSMISLSAECKEHREFIQNCGPGTAAWRSLTDKHN